MQRKHYFIICSTYVAHATPAQAHTQCLFIVVLQTAMKNFVIVRFILMHLPSGTISIDVRSTPSLISFTFALKTYMFCSDNEDRTLLSLNICAWLGKVIDILSHVCSYK